MNKILMMLIIGILTVSGYSQNHVKASKQYIVVRDISTDTIFYSSYLDSSQVWTNGDIEVHETMSDIPASELQPIPVFGTQVFKGELYTWNNKIWQVVQDHNITIYTPDLVPALFTTYRTNSDVLTWITNEKVLVNWIRVYNTISYKCIQAHMTQAGWEPTNTLGVLWNVVVAQCAQWVQPGSTNPYMIGDCVTFNGLQYTSKINNNVWSPAAYPAGWQLKP